MAANTFTTTDLVSLIKLIGHVPQGQSTFTPENLLTLADFELGTSIAAQLKQANEGYWQTYLEYDQNDTGLYTIPSNAVAAATYILQIRNGQSIWPVSTQNVAEMTTTDFPSVGNYAATLQSNTFKVLPTQFDGVLRINYERRPSKLVTTSKCGQVTAINANVVSLSSLPTGWVVGDDIDLQASQPQFDTLGACVISAINGTDVTLTGDLGTLAIGDYLCLSDQTCVPQVPVEFHKLLAQRVVCKIYELQGYFDKLKAAQQILGVMEAALTALITPRTQAAPKIVHPSWGGRQPGNSFSRFNPPAGRNG